MVAHPMGHSVPFANCVHTAWLSLVFGVLMDPTGNQMTKMITTTMLNIVPILFTQPTNLEKLA